MKLKFLVLVAAGAVFAAGAVSAQDVDTFVKNKCLICHDVEKKKMGAPFKESSAKYAANANAVAELLPKLKDGKDGHPKVAGSDEELKAALGKALSYK
ncbi:MAG: hypothetical protein LBS40_07310 [Burkholderiales bacterium]|nr:hypothetical protein [Burkholderiales bacterium]